MESNFFLVYLICSAIRSKKLLPSLTSSKLLAFSRPMEVPSPPLSFRTAVWESSFCGQTCRVYAWGIVYHKILGASPQDCWKALSLTFCRAIDAVPPKVKLDPYGSWYLEVCFAGVLHVAEVRQLFHCFNICFRNLRMHEAAVRSLTGIEDAPVALRLQDMQPTMPVAPPTSCS